MIINIQLHPLFLIITVLIRRLKPWTVQGVGRSSPRVLFGGAVGQEYLLVIIALSLAGGMVWMHFRLWRGCTCQHRAGPASKTSVFLVKTHAPLHAKALSTQLVCIWLFLVYEGLY